MRVIALLGEPGAGKTYVVRRLLKTLPQAQVEILAPGKHGALYGMRLPGLTVLGKYGQDVGPFQGTDALSSAIAPVVHAYLRRSRGTLLFEGSRLTSGAFFTRVLADGHDLRVVHLRPPEATCQRRRAARARANARPEQDPVWVKGQRTRVENAISVVPQARVETFLSGAKCQAHLMSVIHS